MKSIIEKVNNSDIFSQQEKEVLGTLLGVNNEDLSSLLVSEPLIQYIPEKVVELLNGSEEIKEMLFRNKMAFQMWRRIMDEYELAVPLIKEAIEVFKSLDSDTKGALLAELFFCYFSSR